MMPSCSEGVAAAAAVVAAAAVAAEGTSGDGGGTLATEDGVDRNDEEAKVQGVRVGQNL